MVGNTPYDPKTRDSLLSRGSWRTSLPTPPPSPTSEHATLAKRPTSPQEGPATPLNTYRTPTRKPPKHTRLGAIITVPELEEIPESSIIKRDPTFSKGAANHPAIIVGTTADGNLQLLMLTTFNLRGIGSRSTADYVKVEESGKQTDSGSVFTNSRLLKPSWVDVRRVRLIEAEYVYQYNQGNTQLEPASLQALRKVVANKLQRPVESSPTHRQLATNVIWGDLGRARSATQPSGRPTVLPPKTANSDGKRWANSMLGRSRSAN